MSAQVNEHKKERSLERLVDMGAFRKKYWIWDFWGSLAEARRTSEQEESTRMVIIMSMEVLGKVKLSSTAGW